MGKKGGSKVEVNRRIIEARKMRDAGLTLQQIAKNLGFKNHSTIIYYLKKYKDYYQTEEEFREQVLQFDEKPELISAKVSARKVLEVCKNVLGSEAYATIMNTLGKLI